jgi:hypothetical protein
VSAEEGLCPSQILIGSVACLHNGVDVTGNLQAAGTGRLNTDESVYISFELVRDFEYVSQER